MNLCFRNKKLVAMILSVAGLLAACGDGSNDSNNRPVAPLSVFAALTGTQENPPVLTVAEGNASFLVDPSSGQITGSVTTNEITANAAHIHIGDPGINGPIIIGLAQTAPGSGVWTVPANSTLTSTQLTALNSGGLYANVHTDLHPGGQIRGQIGRTVLTTKMAATQVIRRRHHWQRERAYFPWIR